MPAFAVHPRSISHLAINLGLARPCSKSCHFRPPRSSLGQKEKDMTQRIDYSKQSPQLMRKVFELSQAVKESGLEPGLLDLVNIRASIINGCAFCLDMHVKEAKIHGESELRLYHVAIWRESNLFVPR